jgi:YD repeat-containing protein
MRRVSNPSDVEPTRSVLALGEANSLSMAWAFVRSVVSTATWSGVGDGFNFFSKDGSKHHYERNVFAGLTQNTWFLTEIEDRNGNRLQYHYDATANEPVLLRVTDASNRQLAFQYEELYAATPGSHTVRTRLIKQITGPDTDISFDYNSLGQMVSATVNGATQTYEYETLDSTTTPQNLLRAPLIKARSDANGNWTHYDYQLNDYGVFIGATPALYSGAYYKKVTHPESAPTQITYGTRIDPTAMTSWTADGKRENQAVRALSSTLKRRER